MVYQLWEHNALALAGLWIYNLDTLPTIMFLKKYGKNTYRTANNFCAAACIHPLGEPIN
ncbi:MAG TPA: hypothetical protein VHS31_09290 [Tepidisphaeraceae bacterium]|nr:hypothetical protein [Tepidisphaeraceae bacterium]